MDSNGHGKKIERPPVSGKRFCIAADSLLVVVPGPDVVSQKNIACASTPLGSSSAVRSVLDSPVPPSMFTSVIVSLRVPVCHPSKFVYSVSGVAVTLPR